MSEPLTDEQLTRAESATLNRLRTLEWAAKHFDGLTTNRQFPLRVMRKLVERGLVESIGSCAEYNDATGHERWSEGYRMTDAGRAELQRLEALVAELAS